MSTESFKTVCNLLGSFFRLNVYLFNGLLKIGVVLRTHLLSHLRIAKHSLQLLLFVGLYLSISLTRIRYDGDFAYPTIGKPPEANRVTAPAVPIVAFERNFIASPIAGLLNTIFRTRSLPLCL